MGTGPDGGDPNNPAPGGPDSDTDHDGYTPNTGDCNDSSALVNPSAIEMPGNLIDDDCNGQVDEPLPTCDSANSGKNDPTSLVQALDQCDKRFVLGASMNGPSDPVARTVVDAWGVVMPMGGKNMALLSTGIATTLTSYEPQSGTAFGGGVGTPFTNPAPNIDTSKACTTPQSPQSVVYDYTELVVKLKAPSNATSFSFKFQFFSTEYPEWVCQGFNDQFLVLMESKGEFQMATNIAFDMQMNPITVNSGFFTVCDPKFPTMGTAQGQHCTKPLSEIAGTGYERVPKSGAPGDPEAGGSTSWLTTTAPVTPNEDVTLHFVIFDEGDGILDSAVLIDSFRWGAQAIDSPTTIQ